MKYGQICTFFFSFFFCVCVRWMLIAGYILHVYKVVIKKREAITYMFCTVLYSLLCIQVYHLFVK